MKMRGFMTDDRDWMKIDEKDLEIADELFT